jgi:hypothetical protein
MTPRTTLLSIALLALTVLFVYREAATRPVRAFEGDGVTHAGLGQSLAGTYLATVDAVGFPQFLDIMTLHADGTLSTTAGDDFGFGDIEANGFNSPEQGVWKRVGPREIALTTLFFTYDANGVLESLVRLRGTIRFSDDYVYIDGDFFIDIFAPDQNPLHDIPPLLTLPGTATGERLRVQ